MKSNFLRGVSSTLDLFPSERDDTTISIPTHSDEEAIKKDWEQTGDDLYFAINSILPKK